MKKVLLALMLIPLAGFAAIQNWDYLPFISYDGEYPGEVIKQGRNFDLLLNLWQKPSSIADLKAPGFELADADTSRLLKQGMMYCKQGVYHSAIPFIDSVAMLKLRGQAKDLAMKIIDETQRERDAFIAVLDSMGYRAWAFPLIHSLVFDDMIWDRIGVNPEKATLCPSDSMTWNGVFYFYRPEDIGVYGTNGIRLGPGKTFKFAWGDNSNVYLCNVFIQSNVIPAIKNILNGDDINDEMRSDCIKYGVIGEDGHLAIPVLDGDDKVSKAAASWADGAAGAFASNFDGASVAETIGWNCEYNEAAIKVILYHEILTRIAEILEERGILEIPEVLTSEMPSDKRQTSNAGYIRIKL